MKRLAVLGAVVAGVALALIAAFWLAASRGAARFIGAPRRAHDEETLVPELEALGGETVHIRSRDGLKLSGHWVPADEPRSGAPDAWRPDPREAIVLLHGWSDSSLPGLVAQGPSLRRTAAVLALDMRGHGDSDGSPATFGLREVDDVAGALAWLGQRDVERVAIVGRSMGGITAIASVAVLGDGRLEHGAPAPHIVAVVADSVPPELAVPVRASLPSPLSRILADAVLEAAKRRLGGDMRATEPARVVGLMEGVPLLLISGTADTTVPIADARRLAAMAPPGTAHWIVDGAEHGRARSIDPVAYDERVERHLRMALSGSREPSPIIAAPTSATRGGRPAASMEV